VREVQVSPVPTNPQAALSSDAPLPIPSSAFAAGTGAGGHHASGPASHPIAPPARVDEAGFQKAHASPAVRAFARELGVDLSKVRGTGPRERILREDVQDFVKQAISAAPDMSAAAGASTGAGALNLLPWPKVDFSRLARSKPGRCRGSRRSLAPISPGTG